MKTPAPIPAQPAPSPKANGARQSHGIGKWGDLGVGGFQQVPDALLRHQGALGLSPTDLVVLLNVTMHWWDSEVLPFPSTSSIARRMDTSRRTVERSLKHLKKLGLMKRLTPEERADGSTFRRFDFSGLIERLEQLADSDPQHFARREMARQRTETAAANSKFAAGRKPGLPHSPGRPSGSKPEGRELREPPGSIDDIL